MDQNTIRTGMDIFELVKKIHVMHGSDMFDSFRKRIRHGWLIASLKEGVCTS